LKANVTVPDPNAPLPAWLADARGFVLDMDGVLYRGNTPIAGVPEFLASLRAAGIACTMATNNATMTATQYVTKLAGMGITVDESVIVTSSKATRTYLQATYPRGTTIYVVGMTALQEAIFGDGYFTPAEREAQVVVSGADFELTYNQLKIACLAIRAGADYVATNADVTFPSEEGLVPGSGAIVAALSASTSVDPLVVGKPSPVMIEACLELMGVDTSAAVMLGDRLDTDILAGQRAGARTVMVLTGVSTVAEAQATGIVPDVIVPTLAPLTAFYASHAAARR
jgi:4-nitrophenyl phosphatase